MKTKITALCASLFVGAFLFGCNSSSDTSIPVIEIGTLVDAKLVGVSYACNPSANTGKTDAEGHFNYVVGDTCSFSVGGFALGSTTMSQAGSVITPLELVGTTDINNPKVTNLAIFLQSLDADQNPSNGIDLSGLTTQFEGQSAFSLDDTTAEEINAYLESILGTEIPLITAEQATAHLMDTLVEYGIIEDDNTSGSTPPPPTPIDPTTPTEPTPIDNNSVLTCDTSKFQQGAAVATPTSADLISFAFVYVADEGTNNQVMITLDVSGKLTYGASVYPTTSACVETLSGGGTQLVLHTEKGHLDFGSDKVSVNGISPVDGVTIVKTHVVDNGGGDNNTTTGGEGVTIPWDKTITDSNITYVPIPATGGTIITYKEGSAGLEIYDYRNNGTLAIAIADSNPLYSIQLNTTYGSCYLEANQYASADAPLCSDIGINFNRSAGTVTLTNVSMKPIFGSCVGECTINGSLSFEPYN